MEYDFFKEEEQMEIEIDKEYDMASRNLPGTELLKNDDGDQNEEFDVEDMSKIIRQSENSSDIMIAWVEYDQSALPPEINNEIKRKQIKQYQKWRMECRQSVNYWRSRWN